jgi:hypothetical protein
LSYSRWRVATPLNQPFDRDASARLNAGVK